MKLNIVTKPIEKVTIHTLQQKGLPIVRGSHFVPRAWTTKRVPLLSSIHRRLKKVKVDLSVEIARLREEG